MEEWHALHCKLYNGQRDAAVSLALKRGSQHRISSPTAHITNRKAQTVRWDVQKLPSEILFTSSPLLPFVLLPIKRE